ncbi:ribose 5-phosphate isomerase A [Candidatus Bathyarchaeota archaeon]|nr:ribose 5-phosphate isomerase A [Candidatus Bathyarchaeota archaeon]
MKLEKEYVENAKKNAALEAVKNVKNGFVIGLGSGSTVAYAAEELGKRIKTEKLHVLAVPTSHQSFMLSVKNGIPTTTFEENPTLDLTIDGADQIDEKLNLIKGMGGALTREKIVAAASKKLIIIADERKAVKTLGENKQAVPIEVVPFATQFVIRKIATFGGKPKIREGSGKVGPVITDNGNFLIDADFGLIRNPAELEKKLKAVPGVVETGLFVGMTDTVYLGTREGVKKIERKE